MEFLPPAFFRIISLVGGIFILYLAWSLWRQWRNTPIEHYVSDKQTRSGGLWQGVLMNILSPGPYTFWAFVCGPLLVSAFQISGYHAGTFLVGFYSALIGGLISLALLFSQARRLGQQVIRHLILASIVLLVLFAGLLLSKAFL